MPSQRHTPSCVFISQREKLVWLVVLALALGNPLMCLLHCAFHTGQHAHDQQAAFLCFVGQAPQGDTHTSDSPLSEPHPVPQVMYPAVLFTETAWLYLLVHMRRHDTRDTHAPHFAHAPPTPPPRLRHAFFSNM